MVILTENLDSEKTLLHGYAFFTNHPLPVLTQIGSIHHIFPWYPLLFALAIEPLAIRLIISAHLQGVKRGNIEQRVSLYADDLLIYITDPVTCANSLIQILDDFGTFSGYKINLQKTVFPN